MGALFKTMREKITKAFTLFLPMSAVCWYVEEPGAAVAVFIIGFFATLELINLEMNNK
jgi:hypothetical protein